MRFKSVVLLFIVTLLSVQQAHSLQIPKYNVSLSEVIATVERPFSADYNGIPEITNVRADFFQRSTIAEKKKEYRADGQMYLVTAAGTQPLKFRFDYFRPTRQEIVCDGKTLWIYLPENRQVIQSDVADFFDPARPGSMRDRGVNFLQGLGRISKDFSIMFNRTINDQAGNFILELTPKRSSATIQKLFITVSREAMEKRGGNRPQTSLPPARAQQASPFPILSTTVIDHDGNSTTMEFSNAVTNSMVPDMLFRFDVPPEAQVVRPGVGR